MMAYLSVWAHAQPTSVPYTAAGERFDVYVNERFGFVLPYPVDRLAPQPEPPDENGRVFLSPDGSVSLWAFGSSTAPAENIVELFAIMSTETTERSVTYKVLGEGWFVVSGFENDQVYYLKALMPTNCAALVFFRIEYPRELKPVYDPITAEVSDSFGSTSCTE